MTYIRDTSNTTGSFGVATYYTNITATTAQSLAWTFASGVYTNAVVMTVNNTGASWGSGNGTNAASSLSVGAT